MGKSKYIVLIMAAAVLFFYSADITAATVAKERSSNFYINETLKFSARVQGGCLTGTANELVYAGSESDVLLSRLIWEIDKLYLFGFGFSMQYKYFAFHFDGWMKASDGDGTMDDYDWLVPGSDWSDWSHHEDTVVSKAGIFDANLETIIPYISGDNFILSGIAGFKRENYQWQARGGSYVYTDTTFRDTVGNFTPGELGITYEQTYYVPYLGIVLRGSFGPFEVAGRLTGTRLAVVKAEDTHHMRDMSTIAWMYNGDMYSYDVTLTYNFNEALSIEGMYQYSDYDVMRGNSEYHFEDGEVITYKDIEGADLRTSMFAMRFVYSF